MVNIPHVQFKFLRPCDAVATVHLCPSGNSRSHLMSAHLFFAIQFKIARHQRTRTNQGHVTFQDIKENLMTLNIFASLPGRSWKKNAPAPLLAKCSQIVTTNRIGEMMIIAMSEIQKSSTRLKKCLYIFFLFMGYGLWRPLTL